MRLQRRSGTVPQARYARVLDGRHLWLAVSGTETLALRHPVRGSVEVPVTKDVDLVTAVFPVDAAFDDDAPTLDLALVSGSGRKAAPVAYSGDVVTGPLRLHQARWEVLDVDGQLVVRRRELPATSEVTRVARTDQGVVVHLQTGADLAEVLLGGEVIAELPVCDGVLKLADLPQLPPGATANVRCGGVDVVRRRNLLVRPHVSVALPRLAGSSVELRWLRDGRLAVHRPEGER